MLSDNIRNYRKKNNMSQDELADKLNVSRQSVSLWENGQTQPTIDNIIALSKILNVSANELLGEEIENKEIHKKKNNKVVYIIGIIVLIAIIACVFVLGKGKENKEPENTNPSIIDTNFDLFEYCKNYAIEIGEVNGDYTLYAQPASLYGGYEDESFSISYWGDSDMVEFCLHCPLDETFSINFYLRMKGGYDGKYEYDSSYYYRSTGEPIQDAMGYIDPSVFSENYPLNCESYFGDPDDIDAQNIFMEESRVGMCDLIKCLKAFVEVEKMECGFEAFGFVNF